MRNRLICALFALFTGQLFADPVSPDALSAMQRLRVAPNLKVSLWASEPLVQNITSVSYDHQGRAYVVESGRRRTSVFDVRGLTQWLDTDFSLRSESERAAFLRRVLTPTNTDYPAFIEAVNKGGRGGFQDFNHDGVLDWRDLTVESERIRRLLDTDGQGGADQSEIFADHFNGITSGVAAGVLAEGTNVWFTSIPNVWKFPATGVSSNAPSDSRSGPGFGKALFGGFGVHVAFGGHDLHGLIRGPDGRIYFSIADRGANVTNLEGRVLFNPDSGAIFRCETDGSHLELFAKGLRNPQELAFDTFGNLWTGDNNGDGGDKARWTWIVQGADYGWTMGWQWLPKMGAWNSERLWQTRSSNSASYIFPPVAHIGHGPAGIAFYPGIGLGDEYQDHFFYADFPGGIRTFKIEPSEGFFRVANPALATTPSGWMEDNSSANMGGKILWDLSPVDVTFPPFGGLIVADWVQGWEKTGKGRLWHVTDPRLALDPRIAEVRKLLGEGMSQRPTETLSALLSHLDQRVRLEAQWELARRGDDSLPELVRSAVESTNLLSRLHALWGIGQIARFNSSLGCTAQLVRLLPLLSDPQSEIRSQTALLLGENRLVEAQQGLLKSILDPDERVAFAATLGWAKLLGPIEEPFRTLRFNNSGTQKAYREAYHSLPEGLQYLLPVPNSIDAPMISLVPLKQRLALSGGKNPALLHAGSLALQAICESVKDWQRYIAQPIHEDPNPWTRLALLLAERRMKTPAISKFLHDPDPHLVLEAIRAIYDTPIPEILPEVAGLVTPTESAFSPASSTSDIYGWLMGSSKLPWPTHVSYSRSEWSSWILRRAVNAANRLGGTTNANALAEFANNTTFPETTRIEALDALANWPLPPARDQIVGLFRPIPPRDATAARNALEPFWPKFTKGPSSTNWIITTMKAAAALKVVGYQKAIEELSFHSDPTIRQEAANLLALVSPKPLAELLAQLDQGTLRAKQDALNQLASYPSPSTAVSLLPWVQRLKSGQIPEELQLDVFVSASKQKEPGIRELISQWTNSLSATDSLGVRRTVLHGGNAAKGRRLFAERADLGCQRCHKLKGEGGDVGPELTGLAKSKGREYILQSLLDPNSAIATGFESVLIETKDGNSILGILKSETEKELQIQSADAGLLHVLKSEIQSKQRGPSAMPDGLTELMSLHELRDLIEALSE